MANPMIRQNAVILSRLKPEDETHPIQYQDGWRSCRKCRGLFYGGNPDQGACAAGDKQDSSNSSDYLMPFGAGAEGMQTNWRWCQKCQGLFYAGNAVQGACPSGGEHDGGNSLAYDMAWRGVGMETNWQWCSKCEGLFYSGNPDQGACPVGGKHDGTESGAYGMKLGALPKAPVRQLKPQLFLVETYQLSTFRGDLIRGELVATLPAMPPHTETTYKLITEKKTATDIAQSSTVMDSQSAQNTQSFNQQVQDSSDAKSSSEHYDYGMQGNAHAEGSVGFGSVSGDAHVDVAGSTNDARQDIAQSIGHAIDSQVSQANQFRRDQVSAVSEDTKIDESTQTEFTLTRKNDSDQVLNLGVFQMKEEQVIILSLIDVQVAFRNTDSESNKLVKLFELDALLEEVISTAEKRTAIKNQIQTVLRNIRDFKDESKNILVQDPKQPSLLVVNKSFNSTYELKNDNGSTRRVISVPGIILSACTRYLNKPGTSIVLPLV